MPDCQIPETAQDMFCHAVYTTSHVINRAYQEHLAPLGLTYPQYIVLTLLWQKDGRGVGDIASSLEMKTSTVTPLIKRLESNGLVTRRRDDGDERKVRVKLTARGRDLQSNAPRITECMVGATQMDLDELDALVANLKRLRDGIKNPPA